MQIFWKFSQTTIYKDNKIKIVDSYKWKEKEVRQWSEKYSL